MVMMCNVAEWTQEYTQHCPGLECKGMLLQHPYHHEQKCTDCGNYYISMTKWIKTEKPKDV